MQRLMYLKGRFNKGYARKMDDSPIGRMSNIPHHALQHLSKQRQCSVCWKVTESRDVNRP